MSVHAAILLLCALLAMSGVAIVWLTTKLLATKKALAKSNARINEFETVGSEMYLELQCRADQAESRSYIVTCLQKKITDLVSHAATMNAKRFAEEKKAVGASILELLLALFFPATCGRKSTV